MKIHTWRLGQDKGGGRQPKCPVLEGLNKTWYRHTLSVNMLCFTHFFFLTDCRFVATLHQASLLAPYFQQHLVISYPCHILEILTLFQTLLFTIFIRVIFNVTIVIVVGYHKPHPYETANWTECWDKGLGISRKTSWECSRRVWQDWLQFWVISTLAKMPLNSIACSKTSFVKRESVEMANFTVVFF